MKKPEIMAPAGSFASLQAAINADADSVYFGVEQLNMRARAANNFTLQDLKKIVSLCHDKEVSCYLTLNVVLYDHDIPFMQSLCAAAKEAGVDGIIASDLAAIRFAHSLGISVHASTQLNVSNIEAVRFFAQYVDVIVLARELTLQQIHSICESVKKENITGPSGSLVGIEIFIHGALCVAVSGKCYMSLATYNASANRGACLQNCRRAYRVIDEETGEELVLDNKYVMSPKDLCTISFLDKLVQSGVSVLKIEGRGRAPEYVSTVTAVYREALDSIFTHDYTPEKIEAWLKRLETVYNRGFWQGGYYLGKKLSEWSGAYGSQATEEKVFLGAVQNYYSQAGVVCLQIETGVLKVGDKVLIIGPSTGAVEVVIEHLLCEEKNVPVAKKNDIVTFPLAMKVRKNDKVYAVVARG